MSEPKDFHAALAAEAAKAAELAEIGGNARHFRAGEQRLFFWACVLFTSFHLWSLNFYPLDPLIYRSARLA
jgi:hypothetical protein